MKFFSSGLYFSFTYDLTLSKMKSLYTNISNDTFLWNKHLFKDFYSYNIDLKWLVPFIQVLIIPKFQNFKVKMNFRGILELSNAFY